MTCAAAYWPDTGALQAIGVFPEQPDLLTRGHSDGVGELYQRAEARKRRALPVRGSIGKSDPAELLRLSLELWGRPSQDCDRHLAAGQAQRDSRPGIPSFRQRRLKLGGMGSWTGARIYGSFGMRPWTATYVSVPESPTPLRSAVAEARTIMDAAGNTKLTKVRPWS